MYKHEPFSLQCAEEPFRPFADFELTGEAQRNLKLGEWGISARGHLIQAASGNGGDVGAIPLERKEQIPLGAFHHIHYNVEITPFPTHGRHFIFYQERKFSKRLGRSRLLSSPLYLYYCTERNQFYNFATGKPYRARPKKGYWFYV